MTDVIQKRHDTTYARTLTPHEYVRWAEQTHKDRGQLLDELFKCKKRGADDVTSRYHDEHKPDCGAK